jgi:hypothetical protein
MGVCEGVVEVGEVLEAGEGTLDGEVAIDGEIATDDAGVETGSGRGGTLESFLRMPFLTPHLVQKLPVSESAGKA